MVGAVGSSPAKAATGRAKAQLDGQLSMFRPDMLYEQRFTKDMQRSAGRDARCIGMPTPAPGDLDNADRGRCVQHHPRAADFGRVRQPQRMTQNECAVLPTDTTGGTIMIKTGLTRSGDTTLRTAGASAEAIARAAQLSAASAAQRDQGRLRDSLRKTPTLSKSLAAGPLQIAQASMTRTGLIGIVPPPHTTASPAAPTGPGPAYAGSTLSQVGTRFAQESRGAYLGRAPGLCEQRAAGNFNGDAAVPRGKLLGYPHTPGAFPRVRKGGAKEVTELIATPSPHDYDIDRARRANCVGCNTATYTAHRWVPEGKNQSLLIKNATQIANAKRARSRLDRKRAQKALKKAESVNPRDVGMLLAQVEEALMWTHVDAQYFMNMYDADGDGTLSIAELASAMAALGIDVPRSQIVALVRYFDKDGDLELSVVELQHALVFYRNDPKLSAGLDKHNAVTHFPGRLPNGKTMLSSGLMSGGTLTQEWADPAVRRARKRMWQSVYGRKLMPERSGGLGAAANAIKATLLLHKAGEGSSRGASIRNTPAASPSAKATTLQKRESMVTYDPNGEEMPDFNGLVAGFQRRGSAATTLRESGGATLMSVTKHPGNDSLLRDHLGE